MSSPVVNTEAAAAVPRSCKVRTPTVLADAMVRTLGVRPRESWLDPCIGDGVFPRALGTAGVRANRITALDLEAEPRPGDGLARTTRGEDFLAWAQRTRKRFDNIIGNPPYVAISQLPDALRCAALGVAEPGGETVPRGANYWYAFFCASLKLLRQGGNLCFVLPSAWAYADYAAPLRESVPHLFKRLDVHRCERPLFDSVLDGCVVVVGHGFGEAPKEFLWFSHKSMDDLLVGLEAKGGAAKRHRSPRPISLRERGRKHLLGDLIDIRLGGVTGDTRFFLLNEARRLELDLPVEAVRPVLSKSRHLVASEMTRDLWRKLRDAGERIWLLHPTDEYLDHPAVRRYLHLEEDLGGCRRQRFKIRSRDPWCRVRLPAQIDGFLSGMTRCGPWLCFSETPELTATNTLYTFRFKEKLDDEDKAAWALALLEARNDEAVRAFARQYADGLVKYEPGDLYRIALTPPTTFGGARERYRAAIEQMLRNEHRRPIEENPP